MIASNMSQTKGHSGQSVPAANSGEDGSANDSIGSSDISLVKMASRNFLPEQTGSVGPPSQPDRGCGKSSQP
jgi:hypothetical protein